MAIKAGQFLTVSNGFVVDRIQTGGPGALNIPEEKIYELGNYQTVATVRDIPDLSFDLETTDVSCEFESLLLGATPHAVIGDATAGSIHEHDFNLSIPVDIISPFKVSKGVYSIYKGIAVPYLTLERVSYRFGVGANATGSYTLRGDSIYYLQGNPYYEEYSYDGSSSFTETFNFPGATGATAALEYQDGGNTVHALCVTLINTSTGQYKRLFYGDDYTDTTTGFTILNANAGYDKIRVVYGGDGTLSYSQSVHQNASNKPAAVRGKDIDVWIGDSVATSSYTRFKGIQTVEITRSVNLENDQELGNSHYVVQDYVTPEVTGSLTIKPYDLDELYDQLTKVTGQSGAEVIGPSVTVPVPLKIEVRDPDGVDGVLKTILVPDARFQVPGLQGRANQKVDQQWSFTSDAGEIYVYDGSI